jgi:protein-disulfide isomerase
MTPDSRDQTGTEPPVTAPPVTAQPASAQPASAQQFAAPLPGYPAAPRTNTLSIVSLVTGFFCSIAAVITGHLALNQIKRTGETGRGLAIAGLVLGYLGIATGVLALILAVLFAATLGAFFSTVSNIQSPSAVAQGQVGAAYLDDGFLAVGTGPIVVDTYIDPMCPYCGQFELSNGDTLAALVDSGSITLRLHPLTFLDEASQGAAYSSRAAGALTCEAAINPDTTLDYLAALFANQPVEGTTGLTDAELSELSTGNASIADCVDNREYQTWARQASDAAVTGPIEGADIQSIQGAPTVLVDGSQYLGPINDPQALTEFIVGAAS